MGIGYLFGQIVKMVGEFYHSFIRFILLSAVVLLLVAAALFAMRREPSKVWIPVSQLPTEEGFYVTLTVDGGDTLLNLQEFSRGRFWGDSIIVWMNVPEYNGKIFTKWQSE